MAHMLSSFSQVVRAAVTQNGRLLHRGVGPESRDSVFEGFRI